MPEQIRNNHLVLSIEYMYQPKEKRLRETEPADDIIRRLATCLDEAEKFQINCRAFTLRTGNVNVDRVKEIFTKIGVDLIPRRLARTRSYSSKYERTLYKAVTDLSDEEVRGLFNSVDELVLPAIRWHMASPTSMTSKI